MRSSAARLSIEPVVSAQMGQRPTTRTPARLIRRQRSPIIGTELPRARQPRAHVAIPQRRRWSLDALSLMAEGYAISRVRVEQFQLEWSWPGLTGPSHAVGTGFTRPPTA